MLVSDIERTITDRKFHIFLYETLKVLIKLSYRISIIPYQPTPISIRFFDLLKLKKNKLFHLLK